VTLSGVWAAWFWTAKSDFMPSKAFAWGMTKIGCLPQSAAKGRHQILVMPPPQGLTMLNQMSQIFFHI